MDRPMLFFACDLDDYRDWRGFYYSYEEMTPGPVVTSTEKLTDYLVHWKDWFDPEVIRDFRQKFMCSCDGGATQRLLDAMKEKENRP